MKNPINSASIMLQRDLIERIISEVDDAIISFYKDPNIKEPLPATIHNSVMIYDYIVDADTTGSWGNLEIYFVNSSGRKINFLGCLLDLDTGYILLGEKKLDCYVPAFDLYGFVRNIYGGGFTKEKFLKMVEDMKLAKKPPTEFVAGLREFSKIKLEGSVVKNAIEAKTKPLKKSSEISSGDEYAAIVNPTQLPALPEYLNNELLVIMKILSCFGFSKLSKLDVNTIMSVLPATTIIEEQREAIRSAFSGSDKRLKEEVRKQKEGRKTSIDLIAYRLCTGANRHYKIDTPVTHIRQEVIEAEAIIDTIGEDKLGDIYKQGNIPKEVQAIISTKATKALKDVITGKAMKDAENDLIGVDLQSRESAKGCFRDISNILRRFTAEAKGG